MASIFDGENMKESVRVGDKLPVCEEAMDDTVVQNILTKETVTEESDDDDDSDSTTPLPAYTLEGGMKSCEYLTGLFRQLTGMTE